MIGIFQRAAAESWEINPLGSYSDGAVPEDHPPMDMQSMSATSPKPKKPRKPEEVWYDVHKHPDGVPGGMGRSPEHHLRNRGWSPHEIHGSTSRTIQYRNHQYPDFVISYGGGSGTKPDHNFGITYLGTNVNVPKKHRAYSVAEAMNKVEELHRLQSGLIVQPLTAVQASSRAPYAVNNPPPSRSAQQFVAPNSPKKTPVTAPTYPIGTPDLERPSTTEKSNPNPDPQLKQIPSAPAPTQTPPRIKSPKKNGAVDEVLRRAGRNTWEEEL